MDEIGKGILAVTFCLGVIVIGIIFALGINDARFIKAGYTREMLPGSNQATWVKK